mmetsp:Transcript_38485/g.121249  ORF Transcript_38485/g.121249 Transcript_38485/m.121249 type:complete len:213 (-) Transcript_38485:353-991(-)
MSSPSRREGSGNNFISSSYERPSAIQNYRFIHHLGGLFARVSAIIFPLALRISLAVLASLLVLTEVLDAIQHELHALFQEWTSRQIEPLKVAMHLSAHGALTCPVIKHGINKGAVVDTNRNFFEDVFNCYALIQALAAVIELWSDVLFGEPMFVAFKVLLVLCHEAVSKPVRLEMNASSACSHRVVNETHRFGNGILELELRCDGGAFRVEP